VVDFIYYWVIDDTGSQDATRRHLGDRVRLHEAARHSR
jgi:hypothetical protein